MQAYPGLDGAIDARAEAPRGAGAPAPAAPAGDSAAIVSLTDVYASYRRNADALRGVWFEARPGAVVSVLGPAGAGKTALIDVLRLALPPHRGVARILGADALRLSPNTRRTLKQRIGLLAQTPVLADHFTAFENVALPLRMAGRKPGAYEGDVAELLSFVGLAPKDDRPAGMLSGSERRRVAAARAVVAQPRLLLADEPTAGLSPDLAGRVMRLLVSMRRAGAAVIVATQDETLASSLSGPHWRIAGGRPAPAGPPGADRPA